MKLNHVLGLAVLASLFVACGDPEPVATTYKRSYYEGEPAAPGVGGNVPPPVTPVQAPPATSDSNPAGGGGSGDATKGAELLGICAGCHAPGGPGAGVQLNKNVIGRLDNAYQGGPSAFHATYKATHFEGQGRADLEAALNAK